MNFKRLIKNEIIKKDFHDEIEDYCGWLFHISEVNPHKCKNLALLLIEELEKSDHVDIVLLAKCCLIKSLILLDEVKVATEEFQKSLKLAKKNDRQDLGEELINIIFEGLNNMKFLPKETHILILRDIVYFYNHFGEYSESISIMLHIADIFSEFQAFSSAYRILSEAEELAVTENLIEKLADVHSQAGLVAFYEKDFNYAIKVFESAIGILEKIDIKASNNLYINLATSYMQLKQFNKAISVYEKLLEESLTKEINQTIYLNLVVCYRECENLKKAMGYYNKINKEYFEKKVSSNDRIEFYIISANTYFEYKAYEESLDFLLHAIEVIEDNMEYIYRLHYRRGYRERYYSRVKKLLFRLTNPEIICQLSYEKLLRIILFTKMNAFSDWLSLNDWVKSIQTERCTNTEKENLLTIFNKLMNNGMPIIYGYHEKYDDPFEEYGSYSPELQNIPSVSSLWNEFNVVINQLINKYSFETPYKNANSEVIFDKVVEKRNKGNIFMIFSYESGESIIFLYSNGKNITRFDVPIKHYRHFLNTLEKYQLKNKTLKEFVKELQESIRIYEEYFEGLINEIKEYSCSDLIMINNDSLKLFPMIPILYNKESIRKLISNGALSISTVPILSQSHYKESLPNSYLGIFEPFKELPLLEEELKLNEQFNAFKNTKRVNLAFEEEIEDIQSVEFIHMASHGFPISKFSDPIFSSISGPLSKNSFSFAEIQRRFNKYDYKVVFLSMCDSSDQTNNNFFKAFGTDESISFPSLMLLNRKSIVISINWPILDIIPYVFTYYLLEEIQKTNVVVTAFNKAQIKLYNMTIKELLNILDCISDKDLREKKKNMFKAQEENNCPFKNPYIYGAFTLSTLYR
ncbi:tetratricopeptide repeat protein [Bacillus bombysepticus]